MTAFYVDDANQATVICPNCGFAKQIDTTKFKDTKKNLKAKCKCGEVFEFSIEFRKHYRKKVKLPGEYRVAESGERGEIIIEDLSLGGVQFVTLGHHRMSTNNTVTLKFKLNNPAQTEIERSAKIMWIKGNTFGAMFIGPKLFERDLAFYLRM
jgi:hypothetical protein